MTPFAVLLALRLAPPMSERMRPVRARRRFAAGMCALLMVFGTLLPLMSQASSRLFGTIDWIEICTTAGVERIAVDRDGNPADPDDESRPRCIVCTTGTPFLALPPTALPMPPSTSIDDQVALPVYAQPDTTDHFRLETQPRAPPVLAG